MIYETVRQIPDDYVLIQNSDEVDSIQLENKWSKDLYYYLWVKVKDGEYVSVYGSYGVRLDSFVNKLV